MSRRSWFVLILSASLGLPAFGERLRIAYTNDIHLRLERLASIERLIDGVRSEGDPVLVLDAGDAWHDFRIPAYAVWGAEAMVDWMNRVGYAAMSPGNHDLYWSWPKLGALLERAAFPVLCANLMPVAGTLSPFARSARVAVGALDVLIVGLTTAEQFPALDLPWLRPTDPAEALREEIALARGRPDLVVCLAHLRVREAEALARAVPEVDVFLTGHSHAKTPTPRVVGDSIIVQAGAFGRYVGSLLLDVGADGVRLLEGELLETTEEATTDSGRGLAHLAWVLLLVCLFSVVLAL